MNVVGSGDYYVRCPTCDEKCDEVLEYRTDDRDTAKMEARDHREWHPNHRPYARGPNGERIYG